MLIGNEKGMLENLIDFTEHNRRAFEQWLADFGYKNSKSYAKSCLSGMRNYLKSQSSKHIDISSSRDPERGV